MIPLMFTVEREDGDLDEQVGPDWGVAVIRIGRHEIGRIEMTYNEWDDGRDGLEQAVARWFLERLS